MARDLGNHGDHALAAAALWELDPKRIEHVTDSGNFIYQCRRGRGRYALRLTDPGFRSQGQILAELEFLDHLDRSGARVCRPVPSAGGRLVENVKVDAIPLLAVVFPWVPGEETRPGSAAWKEPLFREWGRTLAALHLAGESFRPSGKYHRWRWDEEDWIENAPRYIPSTDEAVLAEYEKVMARMQGMPVDTRNFGMIHGDLTPANMRYAPGRGITVFGFGNCRKHWYVMDLVIALSSFLDAPRPDRNRFRARLEDGYEEIRPLDRSLLAEIDLFLRLRSIYVYVSRLWKYGSSPPPEMRAPMAELRRRVVEGVRW